ncbi:inner membrane-spanning protein YciB [Alphaproteobacteria bacterium LSUCC0684]
MTDTSSSTSKSRLLVEYGPLVLFFLVNAKFGIFYGTAALVAATVLALGYSWATTRRIPKILAFGCAAVVLFGALTLIFEDDTFIKIKPTVVSAAIAAVLLGGLLLGRNPLKAVMGEATGMSMNQKAWRTLTWIWIIMFSTMALANEWAWRNLSTDGWVNFKVFGLTGISLGFAVVMAVFLARHGGDAADDAGG